MTPALPELVALSDDRCEEIVESVSQRVGLYASAWDMVDPHDLVRAFADIFATQPARDSGLGFTACDMTTASAEGFRDGVASAADTLAEMRRRVELALRQADDWYAGDGYETGNPKIDEATNNRWSAKRECAIELRALLSPEAAASDAEVG